MTATQPAWRKLGTFFVGLALVFGAAFGLGRATDPVDEQPPARTPFDPHGGHP